MKKVFILDQLKNSYQQGEQISIVGKPIIDSRFGDAGLIHIYSNDSLINTKQLFYNSNTDTYEGKFWASKAGKLNYKIEILVRKIFNYWGGRSVCSRKPN